MVNSTPSGAEVVHEGNVLGKTPFRYAFPRPKRDLKLTLRLHGHRSQIVTVRTTDASSKQSVKLVPVAHNEAVNPFD